MDGSGWVDDALAERDRGGRFAPGVSGNPAGKRKGTRNRATIMAEMLSADEGGAIARVVIDRALAGDMVAARLCLGLLVAKPRSQPIELDLPAGEGLDDIVAAFDVTVTAMAAGEITPDEALTVSKVLELRRRAIEARARRREREAKRGRDAARTALDAAASGVPAENSAVEAPPPPTLVRALARAGVDLHSACNYGETQIPAEPGETVEAMDAPRRRPLPEFGSACIRPATRGRTRASSDSPDAACSRLDRRERTAG
jgi:hypothetical protein